MNSNSNSRVLIVEDDPVSGSVLADLVTQAGHEPVRAVTGEDAWNKILSDSSIQIAFIDWILPAMDGLTLCTNIKAEIKHRYVYVIMITSKNQKEDLIKGLESGADEFLTKPVHHGELISRLRAGKRVLEYERRLLHEMQRSDALLTNILPTPIATRLKKGDQSISDFFRSATILFMDVVGFTDWCLRMDARQMIDQLGSFFSLFDEEIHKHGLEKIKSIGDAYLVAGGIPTARPDHAEAAARLALSIQDRLNRVNQHRLQPWSIRTGIASGPVIAGVIGRSRFTYDVWGDTVNTASRLEHVAPENQILISQSTYDLLHDQFECGYFGEVVLKGVGTLKTWRLERPKGAT